MRDNFYLVVEFEVITECVLVKADIQDTQNDNKRSLANVGLKIKDKWRYIIMAVDDQYTIALLHFDEDFTDENTNNVWTNSGCTIDKTQPKFGDGCLHIQSKGSLRCKNDQFAFGLGDFTIDFWMYSISGNGGFSSSAPPGVGGILLNSDCVLVGSRSISLNNNTFLIKQWAHYAIVKKVDTIYYFVNGALIKSAQFTSALLNVSNNTIAINTRYPSDGSYNQGENYYDEFRVSNVARWTSDFTPPTNPNSPGVSVNPPTNLIAMAGDSQVTLSWNAVTGVKGYNVKHSTTAGGPYTTIATSVTGTSYVDTTVVNGITYYYVVTAVDSSTNNESTNSNEASATPVASSGHGLLRITMNDSSEREYKLSVSEINHFVTWFNRTVGTGTTGYVFNKAVQNSKEYLSFEKIISFEVIPLTE